MRNICHILLQPAGIELTTEKGAKLRDILFDQGVEFPCGGQGKCKGCKIRVTRGALPVTPEDLDAFSEQELKEGWRLACKAQVTEGITLELRNWQTSILTNEADFKFTPQEGYGVAVDLGTTTLALQLLDLQNGGILAVRTALNPQARFGSDVMSRVQYAMEGDGAKELTETIRTQILHMVRESLDSAHIPPNELRRITLVGNTVMHHLFCGVDVEPLSHYPFESPNDGMMTFTPRELDWQGIGEPRIQFLPGLGSFVGSDILAGVLATNLFQSEKPVGLVDLGTNGEIVIGDKNRLICASTAAGPAFEGAKISMGMRASTGAIWKVSPLADGFDCEVIGNEKPRGICGSGLVDAVAAALENGKIKPTGRFAEKVDSILLKNPVRLTQTDIRQLQLAKGAIAAGVRILLERWGAKLEDLDCLYLAGAFGNYINRGSARRIGLIQVPLEKVEPVGNSALLGAKMALFTNDLAEETFRDIRAKTTHFSLNEDPEFQDIFVEEMSFPAGK